MKLTFDNEALLDGSNIGEVVFQLVPADVRGDVGHLDSAPVVVCGHGHHGYVVTCHFFLKLTKYNHQKICWDLFHMFLTYHFRWLA